MRLYIPLVPLFSIMRSFVTSLLILGSLSSLPFPVLSQAPQLPPFSKDSLAAYTPQVAPCSPHFSLVREAGVSHSSDSLSAGEREYINTRRKDALPTAFQSYLKNLISTGQDIPPTLKSIFQGKRGASPSYGIAFSGGAYRAGLFEAGAITTFDGRNSTSNSAGFGGILQGAEYMAGLSGGGWFVAALAQANMPTVPELIFGPSSPPAGNEYGGFNIAFDVLTPFANNTLNQGFIGGLILEASGKATVGNPVSLIDAFGISLARHFANGTNAGNLLDFVSSLHGTGQLFSGIAKVPAFQTHNLPFPIILSTLVSNHGIVNDTLPGEVIPLSNTKFEYNIFEFGSHDPSLSAFIPMQNLGTVNESSCVTGFDQIAFVLGSTADVFPSVNASAALQPNDPLVVEFASSTAAFQQLIPQANIRLDSALIPNPFAGRNKFTEKDEAILSLADGGIDGANLPLQPLLVKARGLQAIIALDVSGDSDDNFVDGSAMIAESKRVALFPGAYAFPSIPSTPAEFLAQNLTTQPTFFGCDEDQDVPMILYFANGAPPPGKPAITNASTGQLSFPDLGLVQAIIDEAGESVSRGRPQNGEARDGLFPVCVACALSDRERSRLGMKRDSQCDVCFERYCYNPGKKTYGPSAGVVHSALDTNGASASSSFASLGLAKYAPIVIGLLGANLLVSAVLLVLGLLLCIRRRAMPREGARYKVIGS
ncbi:lysophospholipase catalytic domain-containing protein [Mycena rosella]|uniref:Lysophospholipase n=1 Tax=Mycena rosella TaxID=1033263 RepID=A0AAD7GLX9_MYCRO|nr:lysophospholipase catalytic domain-containing protein [Mycena rosella]